jgi:pimeloyl-ACP methyl ester carboxylesterase
MAEAGVAGSPRRRSVQCASPKGLHRMSYLEWGDARNRDVVVCVHGLTRNGRDFDDLARALCGRWRVVCPDVAGRGDSDRLADPLLYALPKYVGDMVTLIARLDVEAVNWVGTSMGGLIGLVVAAVRNSPVQRLVLNDVGPTVEPSALARIGTYLGLPIRWKNLDEAADALWAISQGFGPHTREQWLALTQPMVKADGDGLVPHYDPNIAAPFRAITPEIAKAGEAQIWAMYDGLRIPLLLLRGAQSDLLSPATAKAMQERGPKAELREFEGVGHAPMLTSPDQIAVVREFLLRP